MRVRRIDALSTLSVACLLSCMPADPGQLALPGNTEFAVVDDHHVLYGHLRTNPNSGYSLTRTTPQVLSSTGEPVNCTITFVGIYSSTGNKICFANQWIAGIQLRDRWGLEIKPAENDLEKIRSGYRFPESFQATLKGKTLIRD